MTMHGWCLIKSSTGIDVLCIECDIMICSIQITDFKILNNSIIFQDIRALVDVQPQLIQTQIIKSQQ